MLLPRMLLPKRFKMDSFVNQINRIMSEKNIRRTDLAKRLGVTRGWISQILSSDTNLTLETMQKICEVIGCSFEVNVKSVPTDVLVLRREYIWRLSATTSQLEEVFPRKLHFPMVA